MISIPLIFLGAALGGIVAWLLASSRSQAELVRSQSDAEGRVKAAESTLQEVRARISTLQAALDAREKELGGLQQRVLEESEQKIKAQTELENAIATIGVELRSVYLLSYSPSSIEGGYHTIKVEVNAPGATVHSRPGYWLGAN
jgi:hypothetical protein